eukprot:366547-Chlamydomonas_euryale.AAC.3
MPETAQWDWGLIRWPKSPDGSEGRQCGLTMWGCWRRLDAQDGPMGLGADSMAQMARWIRR